MVVGLTEPPCGSKVKVYVFARQVALSDIFPYLPLSDVPAEYVPELQLPSPLWLTNCHPVKVCPVLFGSGNV